MEEIFNRIKFIKWRFIFRLKRKSASIFNDSFSDLEHIKQLDDSQNASEEFESFFFKRTIVVEEAYTEVNSPLIICDNSFEGSSFGSTDTKSECDKVPSLPLRMKDVLPPPLPPKRANIKQI